MLSFHSVFSPFLNFVHAFGFKFSEIDDTNRACDGYQRRISYTEERAPRSYGKQSDNPGLEKANTADPSEFCFNLHSYEKNGGKTGNPWSLRQMGIYQKFDLYSQKHVWILLQPFSLAQRTLTRILKRCALHGSTSRNLHPMSLHARFMDTAALNWSAYLGDLRNDINMLVSLSSREKVQFRGIDHRENRTRKPVSQELVGLSSMTMRFTSQTLKDCSISVKSF